MAGGVGGGLGGAGVQSGAMVLAGVVFVKELSGSGGGAASGAVMGCAGRRTGSGGGCCGSGGMFLS